MYESNADSTIKITLIHHSFLRVTLEASVNLNLEADKGLQM